MSHRPTAIRVLFVSHRADRSGAPRCLLHLAQHLDRSRFETLAALGEEGPLGEELSALGVPVRLVTKKDVRGVFATYRVARILKELRPDVLHLNRAVAFSKRFALAARLQRIPVIWHLHDEVHNHRLARHMAWVKRLSTCIVSCAHEILRQEGLESTGRVVQNGVPLAEECDPEALDRAAAELALSPRGRPRPFRFLFVGTVIPRKNLHHLVEAAATVVAQEPETEFVVVGGGDEPEYRVDVGRAVDEHPALAERWKWYGEQPDVRPFYRSCDCLVLPSQSEAMPLVLLEAAAFGLPAVATAVGEVPAMLDGERGWLIGRDEIGVPALTKALLEARRAPEAERRARGERARAQVAERFSAQRFTDDFAKLYEELCQGRAASATA